MSSTVPAIRGELERILKKYSFDVVLKGTPDSIIEEQFRTIILPMNLTTLQQAKDALYQKTWMTPEMFGMTVQHQEEIWKLCLEYMKLIAEEK
jgi:hypothetical protein